MENKRYRSFDATVERAEDGTPTKIVGYAVVFDSESVDLGGFVEIIRKGAFTKALAQPNLDVIANVDHDSSFKGYLARTKNGTCRLKEDDHGLAVEIDLPPTDNGRNIVPLMERKDYERMSFCFVPTDEKFSDDGKTLEVFECEIHDVAVVLQPAYPATSCELRERQFDACLAASRQRKLQLAEKRRRAD